MCTDATFASVGTSRAELLGRGEEEVRRQGLGGDDVDRYAADYVESYALRVREARMRAAGIVRCADAQGRLQLALTLATETELSIEAARAILRATPVQAEPMPGSAYTDQFAKMMNERGLPISDPTPDDADDLDQVRRRAIAMEGGRN